MCTSTDAPETTVKTNYLRHEINIVNLRLGHICRLGLACPTHRCVVAQVDASALGNCCPQYGGLSTQTF